MLKRTNTKDLISDSFFELAKTKPINKISVREITENCQITTPMFYYYYKDKDDLIFQRFSAELQEAMDKIKKPYYLDDILEVYRKVLKNNLDYYTNVLRHSRGANSLIYTARASAIRQCEKLIMERFNMDSLSDELKFMIDFYITGVSAKAHDLIIVDPKSIRNLIPYLVKCLPEPLAPYLMPPTDNK